MNPRVVVVEHEHDCTLDRFDPWLREAGCRLEVRRLHRGEDVGDLAGADGLIVLGGSMGATDDEVVPWLPDVRALLVAAVRRGTPTLGICLGAQLLAVACGGRVEPGAAGTEAGLVEVRWLAEAAADPLVGGLSQPFPSPSLHDDAVVELPPDAVLLGSTSTYAHQAFRVASCAWGVQFHPEVRPDEYERWARSCPGVDAAETSAVLRERDAELRQAGATLATRFAAVVSRTLAQPAVVDR